MVFFQNDIRFLLRRAGYLNRSDGPRTGRVPHVRPMTARAMRLASTRPMATFVLLPGAASDSWYWHRVEPLLAAAGHRSIAVDLPCDDDSRRVPRVRRRRRRGDRRRRRPRRADLVLVAQSMAGFTAPIVRPRARRDDRDGRRDDADARASRAATGGRTPVRTRPRRGDGRPRAARPTVRRGRGVPPRRARRRRRRVGAPPARRSPARRSRRRGRSPPGPTSRRGSCCAATTACSPPTFQRRVVARAARHHARRDGRRAPAGAGPPRGAHRPPAPLRRRADGADARVTPERPDSMRAATHAQPATALSRLAGDSRRR